MLATTLRPTCSALSQLGLLVVLSDEVPRHVARLDGRVEGGGIGGQLEHPRQWLGAQWAGLALGVLSCPELPGAP